MSPMHLDLTPKAGQQLAMTPQMQTAIRLLQMNSLEIKDYLSQAMLANPMLAFGDEANPAEPNDDIDWQDYFAQMDAAPTVREETQPSETHYRPEAWRKPVATLAEHLLLQLHTKGDINQAIGEYIIGCIDADGYLSMDPDAAARQLNTTPAAVAAALAAIQTFDPTGVGARDIGECLAIQLRQLGLWTPEGQMLLDDHLLDVANNQFKKVAAVTGMPADKITRFKMLLTELNPRPGAAFDPEEPVDYIIPDGSIQWVDGELLIHVNEISAPRLTLSRFYRRMLGHPDTPETKAYLEACLNKARFVIQCIDMRRETIRKILTGIATYQIDYFFSRSRNLRPMTQSQLAEMTGVHASTVSRAIRGKYVRTPRGTASLKSFFTLGYESDLGQLSVDGVKAQLSTWIQAEDPAHPLSDQALTDRLNEHGCAIARRTVAKYRESLGLPVAARRRRPSKH